jgi:hypothetical protein
MNQDMVGSIYGRSSMQIAQFLPIHAQPLQWFQRRRFLEIDQPETRIVYDSHVSYRIGTK